MATSMMDQRSKMITEIDELYWLFSRPRSSAAPDQNALEISILF